MTEMHHQKYIVSFLVFLILFFLTFTSTDLLVRVRGRISGALTLNWADPTDLGSSSSLVTISQNADIIFQDTSSDEQINMQLATADETEIEIRPI